MCRLCSFAAGVVLVLGLASAGPTQDKKGDKKGGDEPSLEVTHGVVDKADKDSLTVKPRGADGKFQKTIVLKLTGTSKVMVLSPQKRGDKLVLTQRDADPKDLAAGQTVAVIYADAGKDGPVVLSAVVQAAK
jgi:hypothetical protein